MKKYFCVFLVLIFSVSLCACNETSTEKKDNICQEITITKFSEDGQSLSKTSTQISVVDNTLNILGLVQKSPAEKTDFSPEFEFKLKIDGEELIYRVGQYFVDADGRYYKVDNLEEIREKFNQLYDEIDAA